MIVPRVFGKRVVICIPPSEEDGEVRELISPIIELVQREEQERSELEKARPEGLAGHPEIHSLQQWLDLHA